jgi:hypothetical protein
MIDILVEIMGAVVVVSLTILVICMLVFLIKMLWDLINDISNY